MRGKGITYDTGFLSAGTSTREPFDPAVVHREMQIIHDDLHCNAVRITGGYPERVEIASFPATWRRRLPRMFPEGSSSTQSILGIAGPEPPMRTPAP